MKQNTEKENLQTATEAHDKAKEEHAKELERYNALVPEASSPEKEQQKKEQPPQNMEVGIEEEDKEETYVKTKEKVADAGQL